MKIRLIHTVPLAGVLAAVVSVGFGLRASVVTADTPAAHPAAGPAPATRPAYDWLITDQHRQLFDMSCIPMSVEMVLKQTGREPGKYYDLQKQWKNKADGSFTDFDGRTIDGLTFKQQFNSDRGPDFPIDDLFRTIDTELDHGRFVIVSLKMSMFHMFVIVDRTPTGDYRAVSKAGDYTLEVANVKERIKEIQGTDILTYTVSDRK